MKFTIGSIEGKKFEADAFILADSRGLITASSGGGKSRLLRVINESVAEKIQCIVIDPEGEFSTLREKLDILIVGENGDIKPDILSAGLLAKKLAETGVSAVIDLYDISGKGEPWDKRRLFVYAFLNGLMNLPKNLYHPMLISIDEAHNFAMESPSKSGKELSKFYFKQDDSPSLLSRAAVRTLMSAGRKRGFGGILATQRISKIDKDSIADIRNIFIGGTNLDIDQERAGDMLGMKRNEVSNLRDLSPGTFYCFGSAFGGRGVFKFQSANVKTTHPTMGQRAMIQVPKASSHISKIAEQFGDLSTEVKIEKDNVQSLNLEIDKLKRELSARPTQVVPQKEFLRVEVPVLKKEDFDEIRKINSELKDTRDSVVGVFDKSIEKLNFAVTKLVVNMANAQSPTIQTSPGLKKILEQAPKVGIVKVPEYNETFTGKLPEGHEAILKACGQYPNGVTREQLSVLTGYKKDTRNKYIKANIDNGLMIENGRLYITAKGIDVIREKIIPLPTGSALRDYWTRELPEGESKIFSVVCDMYPNTISREEVSEVTGYLKDTRNKYIRQLEKRFLVTNEAKSYIKASSHLWDEE